MIINGVTYLLAKPVKSGDVLHGELLLSAGAPEEIRTPDPQIRSLVLYPAELRARRAHRAEISGGVRGQNRAPRRPERAIAIGSVPRWQGSRNKAGFRARSVLDPPR